MVQNIDSILQRGERLDLLVDKTDTLAGQAYAFRRGAKSVRRQQWWKNQKITFLTGVVVVVRIAHSYLLLVCAEYAWAAQSCCRTDSTGKGSLRSSWYS